MIRIDPGIETYLFSLMGSDLRIVSDEHKDYNPPIIHLPVKYVNMISQKRLLAASKKKPLMLAQCLSNCML